MLVSTGKLYTLFDQLMAPVRSLEGPMEMNSRGRLKTRMESLDTHGCMLPRIDDTSSREPGTSGPIRPFVGHLDNAGLLDIVGCMHPFILGAPSRWKRSEACCRRWRWSTDHIYSCQLASIDFPNQSHHHKSKKPTTTFSSKQIQHRRFSL